jgi:hypothetical protein
MIVTGAYPRHHLMVITPRERAGLSHMVLPLLYSQRATACPRTADARRPNRTQNETESNGERPSCLLTPSHRTSPGIGDDFPHAIPVRERITR